MPDKLYWMLADNLGSIRDVVSYDAVGNLVSKTDRNGRVTEYVYDAPYRLTTEKRKDGRTKKADLLGTIQAKHLDDHKRPTG